MSLDDTNGSLGIYTEALGGRDQGASTAGDECTDRTDRLVRCDRAEATEAAFSRSYLISWTWALTLSDENSVFVLMHISVSRVWPRIAGGWNCSSCYTFW